MGQIALFHSILGVRPGVTDAADRLRAAGHEVLVVDQYDGRTFDDYDTAREFSDDLGFPALMSSALAAVADLPDGFVVAGFSQGAAAAEYVATRRPVAAAVLFGGAVALRWWEGVWPAGVPAQLHNTVGDPFREPEEIAAFVTDVVAAGGAAEAYDYPGTGHLFTDATLPAEYDAAATDLAWSRVAAFLAGR